MCFFGGCIKWSISCLNRSITCILGTWVLLTIMYALALCISAGIAFGYDYALAEYKTLARPDSKLKLLSAASFLVNLFRRSGNGVAKDDEINPGNALEEESVQFTPPTLWMYEPSQRKAQSRNTPVTEIIKMYHKTTRERKKYAPDEVENDRVLEVKSIIYASTTRKQGLSLPESYRTSTKPLSTSPKLDSTSLNSDSTSRKSDSITLTAEMTTKKYTTSHWPSSIMRIFKPKSMFWKWRPTKPSKNFFYKTLAASHRSKNIGQSYEPEMEIQTYRTLVQGKYEKLPIRVWDATTRATEPEETSEDDNAYRNIMYF